MKNILITGANGFLGSNLVKSLSTDYGIIGLVNNVDSATRLTNLNAKLYSSSDSLSKIFEENQIYAVVHAATVYRKDYGSIGTLLDTNVLLPVKLFEIASKHNTELFLNTDSFFNDPNSKYTYLQDYTLSKKHVLEWLRLVCESTKKCKLINLKLFHMYGKDDSPNKFIPQIISSAKKDVGIDLTLGEQTRDFIYMDDVVYAYHTVLKTPPSKDNFYVEYEVGTGVETSIKEFVLILKRLVRNEKLKLNFGALPYRDNEIMKSRADNRGLIQMGWTPQYDIRKGLSEILHNDQ